MRKFNDLREGDRLWYRDSYVDLDIQEITVRQFSYGQEGDLDSRLCGWGRSGMYLMKFEGAPNLAYKATKGEDGKVISGGAIYYSDPEEAKKDLKATLERVTQEYHRHIEKLNKAIEKLG